jgi:putative membrane-bound dehydrogenase-like protein
MIAAILLLALQDRPPIQVPEGFTLELAAGAPLVERPIMASFDDRGRLYVTDSAGVNHKGPELLKNPPHRIRRLEDTDGDGRFDKSSVWADKLVFPQGLLWHDGAVYTISPPSLWKLEDTDGDGVCDKRTELLTGLANTGVADDAHGCCLGPDGRLYFLPGRMAHNLKLPDGTPLRKATGPWLMRCKFDGSEMEFVSGAIGNPVEVDWLPEGDFFIGGTFWAPDSFGGGLRDAVIHGVEGGEWQVRDRTYNDRKRTGDMLPVMIPMAATAPSGLTVYRSGAFGPGWEGNLFCTYFNTHKVQRHVLERDGATFRARTEDFVTSPHADFHPTDVLEDADGSLLVVDTGAWFLIGCPTSKVSKPQVMGGIYRVKRKDHPHVDDPRGLQIDWKAGAGSHLLADRRFAVRERAIQRWAAGRAAGLAEALAHGEPLEQLNAVWAAARIEGAEARELTRRALARSEPRLRQAGAYACGLHRDASAVAELTKLLKDEVIPIRREAATALGRIGKKEAVPALLDVMRGPVDRYLEHAVIFALIRIADREGTLKGLSDENPAVRRATLVALDQMEGGNLTRELVTPLLDPVDLSLREAALKAILARPAWGKEVLGLVRAWIGEGRLQDLRGVILAFAKDAAYQDAVALALRDPKTPAASRALLLECVAQAPLDRTPATWSAEVRWALDDADPRVVRQAVATIRAIKSPECDERLLVIAADGSNPDDLRVEALAALGSRPLRIPPPMFDYLVSCAAPDRPPLLRLSAAEALGHASLVDAELNTLSSRLLTKAGPLELPRLLGAFEAGKSADVGRRLVAALGKAQALASLAGDMVRRALASYPDEVRAAAQPILKKLEVDVEAQRAKLAELEPVLASGDARRGRDLFYGRKASCSTCHTVAGQGGRVGPDLSKIGAIRAGRDLLEAVVFPSASFARGFEPFRVRTKDGGQVEGTIVRETADSIVLFTSERLEKAIARSNVETLLQGTVSVMPQGLDTQLSRDELADLLAYLRSLK